jgi:acyl-CoA thioesterase-1
MPEMKAARAAKGKRDYRGARGCAIKLWKIAPASPISFVVNPPVIARARAVFLAACASSAALAFAGACGAKAAEDPGKRTLVFFGDSLTAGYGLADPGTESYPAVIQRKIDEERLPWRVVNAGLSGETSAGGLRRIDWVLRQGADLFVLELGGNDGLRGIAPEVTRANLQAIIDRVRSANPGARIVIAGMRMPASMGPEYSAAFLSIYPALAKRNSLPLVPFLLEGVAGKPELLQPDGIHPTASGDLVVADLLWKTLLPILH